jgi:hypothetical protein
LQEDSVSILPVRLDDTELPGLQATTGYLDVRVVGTEGIVETTAAKLGAARVAPLARFNGRVPRTDAEIAIVLKERPYCWEYLLHIGLLKRGIDALEDKYRDHEIRYAPRNGRYVRPTEAVDTLERNTSVLFSLVDSFERVLSAKAQDAAFGGEGEPGDPDRIKHLARRLVSVYEEFLDHAADVRGTSAASDALRNAFDLQASMIDQPLEQIRELVAQLVREGDTLVERAEAGTDVILTLVPKLDVDDELMARFSSAVDAFVREQRND